MQLLFWQKQVNKKHKINKCYSETLTIFSFITVDFGFFCPKFKKTKRNYHF